MTHVQPLMVIVTGAPATGKTTLGRRIAGVCRLPYVYKDGIKELLFDRLGCGDRAWSQKLGHVAMAVLFYVVDAQLQAGCSLVVEANFDPQFHTGAFLELLHRHPCDPLQILCRADAGVLAQRYRERARSGARHLGHLDQTLALELDPGARLRQHAAMELGGRVLVVDTSRFETVDYEGLIQTVKADLARRGDHGS